MERLPNGLPPNAGKTVLAVQPGLPRNALRQRGYGCIAQLVEQLTLKHLPRKRNQSHSAKRCRKRPVVNQWVSSGIPNAAGASPYPLRPVSTRRRGENITRYLRIWCLHRYAEPAYIGHRLRGMVPRADRMKTMNTFATVRAALTAVLSLPDAAIEGMQYEVEAAFDIERNPIGYRVRIKDLDGFGKGYV